MAKLETTSADNTIAQRKEDDGSENSGAGGSSDDSSNGGASIAGVQGRTRRLAEAGSGKEGVLTQFSWGCAQMATYFALAGKAR
jgi:hypothetical protein